MVRREEGFLRVSGWVSGFESVDKALRHYGRRVRSEKTRRNLLSFLYALCRFSGKNPDELVRLSVDEASKIVQSFVDDLAGKGRSVRYVNVALAYIKTFFRVNDFENDREIKVERYFQPSRYRKRPEYVPTPEEIERMAYAAGSKRNKALILMLYTTGLRVSTLRALRVGDVIEELKKGLSVIKIEVHPKMKNIIPEACKGGIPYYTFASAEAVEALKEYLDERLRRYGRLDNEEPLFCSDTTNMPIVVRVKTPIIPKSVQQIVKKAARRAGIGRWKDLTPHCLRKAFESALRNNGLDVKDQEFLMGHILPGSQDAYYDHSKAEDLRMKYAKIRFFKKAEIDKLEMVKAFAKTLGIENIEVKIQRVKEEQPEIDEMEALGKIMREELGLKPLKTRNANPKNEYENCHEKPYKSKIIEEEQLIQHVEEGWEVVKELRNGRFLLRKQNHQQR